MSNRTNKKAPDNRGNNEEKELEMLLRSIWLGLVDAFQEEFTCYASAPVRVHTVQPVC